MWDRRAKYIDNHDGDTVNMLLDQGFGDTKHVSVRLLGVFAPELKQLGGADCRDFVEAWFKMNAKNNSLLNWGFVVTTARMKVADREQKTLDRYVGTITNLDGTANLNAEVIHYIHKKSYSGGTGS